MFSLWGAISGGANLLKHGAGWLESELCASFKKFILDVDLLQMVAEYLKPVTINEEEIALQTINEVGPGGISSALSLLSNVTPMLFTLR